MKKLILSLILLLLFPTVSFPAIDKDDTIHKPDIVLSSKDSLYQAVKDYLSSRNIPQQRPPLDLPPPSPQP